MDVLTPENSEFGVFKMLSYLDGDDGDVVTVYSRLVAIGGLCVGENGHWHWALFALRRMDFDDGAHVDPLGGMATSREHALAALVARWNLWLNDSGLVIAEPLPS
ncbi:hypothetical protein GCM10008171_31680 [Methylopila jiangsuensis]|uniref:Uncharacterized protein n=1 Tax=Methylopila jiangsuensis TaxID=586230 RepID=A0A9W6JLI4_9HYPH|nr:hypothetical protein [Methylopila jiangsuensis]MDR6284697.1 hypothetical protein [Methylopila jiangsuensis]GLK77914.1 hypothetical protein GCM10008171_31680 [Methylopila jiangsuensis]